MTLRKFLSDFLEVICIINEIFKILNKKVVYSNDQKIYSNSLAS